MDTVDAVDIVDTVDTPAHTMPPQRREAVPKPTGPVPRCSDQPCTWDADDGCWRAPDGSIHTVERHGKRKADAAAQRAECERIDAEASAVKLVKETDNWEMHHTLYRLTKVDTKLGVGHAWETKSISLWRTLTANLGSCGSSDFDLREPTSYDLRDGFKVDPIIAIHRGPDYWGAVDARLAAMEEPLTRSQFTHHLRAIVEDQVASAVKEVRPVLEQERAVRRAAWKLREELQQRESRQRKELELVERRKVQYQREEQRQQHCWQVEGQAMHARAAASGAQVGSVLVSSSMRVKMENTGMSSRWLNPPPYSCWRFGRVTFDLVPLRLGATQSELLKPLPGPQLAYGRATDECDFAPDQWPNYNVMYRDVHHRLAKGYYP